MTVANLDFWIDAYRQQTVEEKAQFPSAGERMFPEDFFQEIRRRRHSSIVHYVSGDGAMNILGLLNTAQGQIDHKKHAGVPLSPTERVLDDATHYFVFSTNKNSLFMLVKLQPAHEAARWHLIDPGFKFGSSAGFAQVQPHLAKTGAILVVGSR